MSYGSYDYVTRKQCNVIFKAFKRGQLTPPKDCRGKVKREGFVYRYEGVSRRCGFYLDKDEDLLNCQLEAVREVCSAICNGELDKAQAILDGEDETFNWNYLPPDVEPSKMWRVV